MRRRAVKRQGKRPSRRARTLRAADWLVGGGDASDLVRGKDWAKTPLGPRSRWPQSLRTSVSLVLQCGVPAALVWGPGLTLLANDAFRRALGRPADLPGTSVLVDLADLPMATEGRLATALAAVFEHGESLSLEDERAAPDAGGELARFAAAFSPVRGERGSIEGVLVTLSPQLAVERLSERLRESEQRLAVIYERAPFGIAVTRMPEGTFADVNAAFLELFGFTREEVLGKTSVELGIEPALAQSELRREFGERGTVRDFEVRRRTKRGDDRWLSVNVDRITIGRQDFVMTSVVDITARRCAETALRDSEARFRQVVDGSLDGITMLDLKTGRYVFVNRAQAELTGFSVEELRAFTAEEAFARIHPDDRHLSVEQQRLVASGRELGDRVVEYRWKTKSGDYRWFGDRRRLIRSASGEPMALVGNSRDITQRRRSESEQRTLANVGAALSSLDPMAALKGMTQAMLLVADYAALVLLDERQARCVASSGPPFASEALERLLAAPAEARPDHPVALALEHHAPVLQQLTPEHLAALAHDERHHDALRDVGPRSVLVAPLLVGDDCVGALALVGLEETLDDRAVLLAEEIARRCALFVENQRLHEAERRAIHAREEVLGVVAHDLRNPLNTIVLQSRLLRRRGAQPERRATRPGEAIERAAARMNRFIQDLLDLTRLDAGRFELEREAVPADGLLREIADAQRELVAARGIELRVSGLAPMGVVWGDRDRLIQVFENLIGNALKFTHRGSISVGARLGEGEIVFSVADTGAGIPPEHIPHLFDRFWQARKTARSGAGLGLDIVKGIVEAHGGRVWVESEVGAGSTFFFTVPCAPDRPDHAAERRAEAAAGPAVLVAEDEPETREALVDGLTGCGFSVTAVANGREALDRLHGAPPPDVVILDLSMPVMDGWQFLRERGRDPALSTVPVIVVSAERGVARQVAAANARFLEKPISFDQLIAMVNEARREHAAP